MVKKVLVNNCLMGLDLVWDCLSLKSCFAVRNNAAQFRNKMDSLRRVPEGISPPISE
jgi:hypothetical protein